MPLIVKHYTNTAVGSQGEATLQLQEPAKRKESVAMGAQSTVFDCDWIAVQCDAAFKCAFAANPGVGDLANEFTYPANSVFVFRVPQGSRLYVAAA